MKDLECLKYRRFRFRPVLAPPSYWRANMITMLNCYLLWVLIHLMFVTERPLVSLTGRDLDYYSMETLFGLNIPEIWFVVSILMTVFAYVAIIGQTRYARPFWKRLFIITIFATICNGYAFYIVSRGARSYEVAKKNLEYNQLQYEELSLIPVGSRSESEAARIRNHESWVQTYSQLVEIYEKRHNK